MLNREWLLIKPSKKDSIPILDLSPKIYGIVDTRAYNNIAEINITERVCYQIHIISGSQEQPVTIEEISEREDETGD